MGKYTKGKIVKGVVSGIENYGVFVKIDEYYSGLIHISEISNNYVNSINDYVKIGDTIYVEVLNLNEELSQMKLSIKNIAYKKGPILICKKIFETRSGFKTLSKKLPVWIEENLKNNKKQINSIDK